MQKEIYSLPVPDLNLHPEDPVIAAISGGPDSMALLSWLEHHHLNYVIAHVNYHKRQTSGRDEQIVRDWAARYQRPLWVLNPHYQAQFGNFQGWARNIRYAFFARLGALYQTKFVFVGHQQDDAIETWMMQKKRQLIPERYGLQTISQLGKLVLVRPFLAFSKADLQRHCQAEGILYGVDESNVSDAYLRNQLRHSRIEPADEPTRQSWLQAMANDNQVLQSLQDQAFQLAKANDFEAILKSGAGFLALDLLLYPWTNVHFSKPHLEDLLAKLQSKSMQTLSLKAKDSPLFSSSVLLAPAFQKRTSGPGFEPSACAASSTRYPFKCLDNFVGPSTFPRPFDASYMKQKGKSKNIQYTKSIEPIQNEAHPSFPLSLLPLEMVSGSRNLNVQVVANKLVVRPAGWISFYVDSKDQLDALMAQSFEWGCFALCQEGKKIESFATQADDFPLIIRSYQLHDSIEMRFGTKKINRLWIDRKIAQIFRPFYPVIEGRKGILFAALAGCDRSHFMENATAHMLKLHT